MTKSLLVVAAALSVLAGSLAAQAGSSISAPQKWGNNSRNIATASTWSSRGVRHPNYGISEFSSSSARTSQPQR
jgi:hypothetical protein